MSNKYILAMYDIRGKQEYIYKSNKMKEIIGASYIIRDCFKDYLYPAAKAYENSKGLFDYKSEVGDTSFSEESFKRHLTENYVGEVVYDGGGNFFVLFKDINAYEAINKDFYRRLLIGTYSLKVLTSYIEVDDFSNYKKDQMEIYRVHRQREQKETLIHPINALPIVQVDERNYLPLAKTQWIGDKTEKVSYETKCKYQKYEQITGGKSKDRIVEGERLLDEIVTSKGEESLLAVVYIDGNNMGAKVAACTNGEDCSYATCIAALRKFSEDIHEYYIEKRIKNVDDMLDTKKHAKRRFVVYAGDEITFICNARYAYDVAIEYLQKLSADDSANVTRTSCAGIAIFHSHMPFSEAYRIAEECCESGKKLMKQEKIQDTSLLDYHYCQGAIGTSLDDIREQEENIDISRPWFISCEKCIKDKKNLVNGKYVTKELIDEMNEELKKVARGNIKGLLFSAKKSEADFLMEVERICAHYKAPEESNPIDFSLGGKLEASMQRKLLYDMATVYDLWFRSC